MEEFYKLKDLYALRERGSKRVVVLGSLEELLRLGSRLKIPLTLVKVGIRFTELGMVYTATSDEWLTMLYEFVSSN